VSEICLRPDRKLQTSCEIEEGHGAVLELSADDPFRRQPQSITVELERLLEVGDAQCQDGNARLHGGPFMRDRSRMQA
jgi:hypothetical protein